MSNLSQFSEKLAKLKTQTFTSSGTFTVPAGVETLFVTMCGGGGGFFDEQYYAVKARFGAGSAGYYLNEPVTVTPGTTLTVAVAAGGSSAVRVYYANGSYGYIFGSATTGGTSSIANGATTLIKATGGGAGRASQSSGYSGNGGWPRGSGGGANAISSGYYGFSGCAGVGGTNAFGLSSQYSIGLKTNVDVGSTSPGMGEFPGTGSNSAVSPIPGGYGAGANWNATYNDTVRTPGGAGIITISYFEV